MTGLTKPIEDEVDFVIVGTGAAGASAARFLTGAGASVLLLEEGPHVPASGLGQGTMASFLTLLRENGSQMTRGRLAIPILQAACVGGSTVVNSGITWRIPEPVLADWHGRFGLEQALPARDLEAWFELLERELSVKLVDEERLGGNGRALREGARRLGLEAKPTHRTESGCEGLSRCLEGCVRGRRQSMNHSYVPRAIAAGARLVADCKVLSVTPRRGRSPAHAVGRIRGEGPGAPERRLVARARRAVLVAASAVHTPPLLQRSGLDFSGQLGLHFQGHPGVSMLALFDDPVRTWEGATQSYEVTAFRHAGFKIESLNLPPEMLATRLPGAGRRLVAALRRMDRLAVAAMPIRAAAEGSIRASGEGVSIRYVPGRADVTLALEALATVGEIFFAAGARVLFPGVHGLPEALVSPGQLDLLRRARPDASAFSWVMTHLMGSCRMGVDPARSAVGLDGGVHGAPGIHVIDSSVFPTNLGVNPQHTIMAIAMQLSQRILRV